MKGRQPDPVRPTLFTVACLSSPLKELDKRSASVQSIIIIGGIGGILCFASARWMMGLVRHKKRYLVSSLARYEMDTSTTREGRSNPVSDLCT